MAKSPRLPPSVTVPAHGRRSVALVAGLLALACLSAADRVRLHTGPRADFDRYHGTRVKVVHVVDGDTIDVDLPDGAPASTRVRLWGVDAPEVAHDGRPAMYFGEQAAEFARRHLEGERVRLLLVPERTRDRYGRLLAYVQRDEDATTFNEKLVSAGFAYADPRFAHPLEDAFRLAEHRSRRTEEGLWAGATVESLPPWRGRLGLGDGQGQ